MSNKDADPALEPALRDVESIQSLDTARLALRWALERMRALEKHAHEAEDSGKRAESAGAKAASELDSARDLLTRRAGEAAERERYYAKIEEYLNLKLAGGLDAAALAKREARVEQRESELQSREIATENRLKLAQRRAEEETRHASAEAAAAADARIREIRDEFERRTASRDRDMSERLLTAHEKEAQLSALERSLEERRLRFEEFFTAQRAALQRESVSIAQAVSDQTDFMETRIEQALAARTAASQRAWQTDKQALMEELASWRAKAREHLPALLEAQRRAAALDEEHARLLDENRLMIETKAALEAEVLRWRAEARSGAPVLLAGERRVLEAENLAARRTSELADARRAAEEARAELMSQEIGHGARVQELARLEAALAAKLRDAEQDLFRQYDAWIARESELRRRDQDWRMKTDARKGAVELLRAEITAQREELTRAIAAYRIKAENLGQSDGSLDPKGDAL